MKPVPLSFSTATDADAASLAGLRSSTADHLTELHGRGHWSAPVSEAGVLRAMESCRVLVGRNRGRIVGMLALATKKPWAIDTKYFARVERALYLHDMAVAPRMQGRGIGRRMLEAATEMARSWPAQAIRLDAYDAEAGAGAFYARCGYTEVGRVTYRKVALIYYELLL
ncbi:MAG TPA: GNAT family N-acetyltransferase [Polyangiaceae bacterium]